MPTAPRAALEITAWQWPPGANAAAFAKHPAAYAVLPPLANTRAGARPARLRTRGRYKLPFLGVFAR